MLTEIESAVIKAIAAQKNIDEARVTLDLPLEELGISSLDAITIIYEIEDALNVEIPNDQLDSLERVSDIVDGVAALLNGHG